MHYIFFIISAHVLRNMPTFAAIFFCFCSVISVNV